MILLKVFHGWLLSYSQLNTSSVVTSCINNTNTNNNNNSNENIYDNNSNENIALNDVKTEELRLSSRFASVNNINNDDCESNSLKSNHESNRHEPNKPNFIEAHGESV